MLQVIFALEVRTPPDADSDDLTSLHVHWALHFIAILISTIHFAARREVGAERARLHTLLEGLAAAVVPALTHALHVFARLAAQWRRQGEALMLDEFGVEFCLSALQQLALHPPAGRLIGVEGAFSLAHL